MSPYHKRQMRHATRKISDSLEQKIMPTNTEKEKKPSLPEKAFFDKDIIHAILLFSKSAIKNSNNTMKHTYDFVDSHVDTKTDPRTYAIQTKKLFYHLKDNLKKQLAYHYIPRKSA